MTLPTQSQIRDALDKLDDHILGCDIKTNVDKYCCYLNKEEFDTINHCLQSALDTQKPAGDAAVCIEYDWKCTCCKTEFKDKKPERDENDNNGGAKCPCCKADGQYTYRSALTMDAVESLKSVLCDPEGKCCISGSDADRKIVDDALAALTGDCGGGDRPDCEEMAHAAACLLLPNNGVSDTVWYRHSMTLYEFLASYSGKELTGDVVADYEILTGEKYPT